MQPRHILILILALLLLGGSVAVAQDGTTTIVAGQPTEMTAGVVIPYGANDYAPSGEDGPVLAYVDAVIETEAGVEVVGTLLVHDATGWRVVGAWLDPAPSTYADALPGDILSLAMQERLGAGQ